jgi:hypothetical protein
MITITPEKPVETFSLGGVQFHSQIFHYPEGESGTTRVHITETPQSFLKGLADCNSGRVIDMQRAMNEPPPPVD